MDTDICESFQDLFIGVSVNDCLRAFSVIFGTVIYITTFIISLAYVLKMEVGFGLFCLSFGSFMIAFSAMIATAGITNVYRHRETYMWYALLTTFSSMCVAYFLTMSMVASILRPKESSAMTMFVVIHIVFMIIGIYKLVIAYLKRNMLAAASNVISFVM